MSTTAKIDIPPGQWTEVSAGSANVRIWGAPSGYRVAVGAAAPADLTIGLLVGRGLAGPGLYELLGLANTDNVYLSPADGRDFTAQVIAS